jgi:hypothetical protein
MNNFSINNANTINVVDVNVSGNLVVSGNTTVINTTNLTVNDAIITLNSGQVTPLNDIGIVMQRFSPANSTNYNVGLAWEEGTDRLVFGTTSELGADNDLSFDAEWMTITGSGNVGIGTTSPTQALQVERAGITSIRIRNSNFNDTLLRQGGNSFDIFTQGVNHPLAFGVSNAERMRIDGVGRVGIGTTIPVTRLHVGGNVVDDNGYAYNGNTAMVVHQLPTSTTVLNDPQETLLLARYGTGGQAYGAAATFDLSRYENSSVNSRTRLDIKLAHGSFLTSPTVAMTLLSSGNVGIGNTAPANRLFITGDVGLDGISVRDTSTLTTTATTQVTLIEYPTATYNTGEFVIQAVSAGVIHTTKMLVVCNTTVAIATEFGSLLTGGSLFTVDCDISSANTRIRITPASTTSTTFKSSYELITA